MEERAKQRVFILGSGGRLGAALMKEWKEDDSLQLIGLSRTELDFENSEKCFKTLKKFSLTPRDFIINCAAMTNVDQCEEESDLAMKVNAITPGLLAQLAADAGARFLHVSTDYVFDGKLERAYRETDQPHPISRYGASKLGGEEAIMATSPHHYVARVSWVFGPERPSFVDQIIKRALTHDQVAAIDDKTSSPAYTKDLAEWFQVFLDPKTKPNFKLAEAMQCKESRSTAEGCINILDEASTTATQQCAASVEFQGGFSGGIYHLCNSGLCSWREYGEYALQVAARYGMPLRTTSVAPLKLSEMKNFIAQRPQHSALDTTKFSTLLGKPLRSWQEAVEEFVSLKTKKNLQG